MEKSLPRPQPLTAPTWSWASTLFNRFGPGDFSFCNKCLVTGKEWFLICVENVDVKPATVNPFGPMKPNATVVISGALSSGFLRYGTHQRTFVVHEIGTEIEFFSNYNLQSSDKYYVPPGAGLVCVYWDSTVISDFHMDSRILILRPAGEQTQKYERIGLKKNYGALAIEMRKNVSVIARKRTITLV
jgi:hypothetical protein